MPDNITEALEEAIALTHSLPLEPAAYSSISKRNRKLLREKLESAVSRLGTIAQTLDSIRLPKHVFDPTSPQTIGKLVAETLLLQEREPLQDTVNHPFYGAGVYAIYYRGPFDSYAPVSGREHPLYVGKADPEAMHAATPQDQGNRLYRRLKEHHRNLCKASNLDISDFDCRHLVVRSAWVETAEDMLIDLFKPIWNSEIQVCYGFGKHGDDPATRGNERSPWDTLHPGRGWATSEANTPNKLSVEQIKLKIAGHFVKFPPK